MITLRPYLDRWRRWRESSANHSIFAGMLAVGMLTLLARAIGFAKEMAVSYRFGRGDALDAYLITLTVPYLLIVIVTEPFNFTFTPIYIETRERHGDEAARQLARRAMGRQLALVLAVLIALTLIAPLGLPVIAAGFSPAKLALTQTLLYFQIPCLAAYAVGQIWACVLNAHRRFAAAAVSTLLSPIVILLAVLTLGERWGIYGVAVGSVGGSLAELIVMGLMIRHYGLLILPGWGALEMGGAMIVWRYTPMVISMVLTISAGIFDQAIAASLVPGSVAALSYGNKLVSVGLGVGVLAVSSTILPHFSRMAAQNDWGRMRHTLRVYSALLVGVTVPLTLVLIAFSHPLVALIYQRGAFTAQDTDVVSQVQAFYALQLPFNMLTVLFSRLAAALGAHRWLALGALINLVVNISLDLAFAPLLGAAGIALSTACVFAGSTVYYVVLLVVLLRHRR